MHFLLRFSLRMCSVKFFFSNNISETLETFVMFYLMYTHTHTHTRARARIFISICVRQPF